MNKPCFSFRQMAAGCACWPLLIVGLSGCGGGASATPSVTYRPSHPEVAAEAAPGQPTETAAGAATEAPVATGGVGTLRGTFVVQGNVTPLPPLYAQGNAPKDAEVCGIQAAPDETVVVNDGKLAYTFIYLAKAPKGAKSTAPTEPVEFDQISCIFKPHALVVHTGQVVKILNDDAALHNTHTFPVRNSGFNQGVSPKDRSGVNLVYSQAEKEPISVKCDVHPWMQAWHLPIDHSFAAVSGANGEFVIKDLPAGKHSFKIWHEKGGELEKAYSVTIKPGEENVIQIPIAASKLAGAEGPRSKVIQLTFAD